MICPNCDSDSLHKYTNWGSAFSLLNAPLFGSIIRGAKAAYYIANNQWEADQFNCKSCSKKYIQCGHRECNRRNEITHFYQHDAIYTCPYCHGENRAKVR